jgi:hypothetical protein
MTHGAITLKSRKSCGSDALSQVRSLNQLIRPNMIDLAIEWQYDFAAPSTNPDIKEMSMWHRNAPRIDRGIHFESTFSHKSSSTLSIVSD